MVEAIRKIHSGRKFVSSSLAERLVDTLGFDPRESSHEKLSDREFQVLRLIAVGKTGKEIADELLLSPKTVSTYRCRILEKLDMKSSSELVHYALRKGLMDLKRDL